MSGHPHLQAREEPVEPEHLQVGVGQRRCPLVDDGADPCPLVRGGEAQAGIEADVAGVIAGLATEDEGDGGEHALVLEALDHLHPPRREEAPPRSPSGRHPAHVERLIVETAGLGVRTTVDQGRQQVQLLAALVSHAVEVVELDRPSLLDHRLRRSAHGGDPVGQLLGVRHRGRQAHERHVGRQVDHHLLPHRPAVGVLEEVHLVEHHVAKTPQRRRSCVDHVAEDLGGHHHHGSVSVDGVVTGEEPDPIEAVAADEIRVLLVRQRLDRCRVEGLVPLGQRLGDGVLRHHRLAAAGGRGDEHRPALVERRDRPLLERVEREVVPGAPGPSGRGGRSLAPLHDPSDDDRHLVEQHHRDGQHQHADRVAGRRDHRDQHADARRWRSGGSRAAAAESMIPAICMKISRIGNSKPIPKASIM